MKAADLEPPPDANRFMPHRMVFVLLLLIGAFGVVFWRLHKVQIVEQTQWTGRADKLVKRRVDLPSLRGSIMDCNDVPLALDKTEYDLWINLKRLQDFNDVRERLARITGIDAHKLNSQLGEPGILAEYRKYVATTLQQGWLTITLPEHQKRVEAEQRRAEEENRPPLELPLPMTVEEALSETRKQEFVWSKDLSESAVKQWRQLLGLHKVEIVKSAPTKTQVKKKPSIVATSIRARVKRFYPSPQKLTHVIGCVKEQPVDPRTGRVLTESEILKLKGKIQQFGTEGIEAVMNKELTGKDGYRRIEQDSRGREIPEFRGETVPPQDGHDIVLTVDMQLQDIVEEVIEEAFAFYDPKDISIVLIEPKSGEIRAMATRPHIDRSKPNGTNANLAVFGRFEPGSVFKIITYATALETKCTSPTEMLNCNPSQPLLARMQITNHAPPALSTTDAFAISGNHAAYLLASRVGERRFLDSVAKFGFGRLTGVALTGEAKGTVHKPDTNDWDKLTFSRMAYGHAIEVTPLQMCLAVGAIANGGFLMKPQIIKQVRNSKGEVIQSFSPEVINRVCSQRAAAQVRDLMIEVIENPKGTGHAAKLDNVRVAGKTGTSQLYDDKTKDVWKDHYRVSFAGFAPAEDPTLCAIVVVHDPKLKDASGGKVAAPIFAKVMQRCLQKRTLAQGRLPTTAPAFKGN
ncbi:MAG: peptidoglycan D,D-transpeptidase FtsI family protein [Roseimicrobium sp.]